MFLCLLLHFLDGKVSFKRETEWKSLLGSQYIYYKLQNIINLLAGVYQQQMFDILLECES